MSFILSECVFVCLSVVIFFLLWSFGVLQQDVSRIFHGCLKVVSKVVLGRSEGF